MPVNHRVKRAPKHPKVPKMCFPKWGTTQKKPRFKSVLLEGGPYHFQVLRLTDITGTLPMRVGNYFGRYVMNINPDTGQQRTKRREAGGMVRPLLMWEEAA